MNLQETTFGKLAIGDDFIPPNGMIYEKVGKKIARHHDSAKRVEILPSLIVQKICQPGEHLRPGGDPKNPIDCMSKKGWPVGKVNPVARAKRKPRRKAPSPAQLRARAKFVAMVRARAAARRKKMVAPKRHVKKNPGNFPRKLTEPEMVQAYRSIIRAESMHPKSRMYPVNVARNGKIIKGKANADWIKANIQKLYRIS
jgi:hypothetical protein